MALAVLTWGCNFSPLINPGCPYPAGAKAQKPLPISAQVVLRVASTVPNGSRSQTGDELSTHCPTLAQHTTGTWNKCADVRGSAWGKKGFVPLAVPRTLQSSLAQRRALSSQLLVWLQLLHGKVAAAKSQNGLGSIPGGGQTPHMGTAWEGAADTWRCCCWRCWHCCFTCDSSWQLLSSLAAHGAL